MGPSGDDVMLRPQCCQLLAVVDGCVHLPHDGISQQEAHIVPELLGVAHRYGHYVGELVDGDEQQGLERDELLLLVARPEAKDDAFALAHRVRRVLGVGVARDFGDGRGVEARGQERHTLVVRVVLAELVDERLQLLAATCKQVGRLLLVREVAHLVVALVHGRLDQDQVGVPALCEVVHHQEQSARSGDAREGVEGGGGGHRRWVRVQWGVAILKGLRKKATFFHFPGALCTKAYSESDALFLKHILCVPGVHNLFGPPL